MAGKFCLELRWTRRSDLGTKSLADIKADMVGDFRLPRLNVGAEVEDETRTINFAI